MRSLNFWTRMPVVALSGWQFFLGEGKEAFSAVTAVSLLLVTAGVVISERRQKNASGG